MNGIGLKAYYFSLADLFAEKRFFSRAQDLADLEHRPARRRARLGATPPAKRRRGRPDAGDGSTALGHFGQFKERSARVVPPADTLNGCPFNPDKRSRPPATPVPFLPKDRTFPI